MEIEALVGLAALPLVVTVGTDHAKRFFRAIRDRKIGGITDATPWPLVADVVGTSYAVAAWYAGYIPNEQVDSVLGAILIGFAASLVAQGGYNAIKGK